MRAYRSLLELLDHRTHGVSVLSRALQSRWCIFDLQPICGKCILQMPQQSRSILLRPEISIDCVNLVQILLLVPLIVARYMPLVMPLDTRSIYSDRKEGRLLVRVRYPCGVEIAGEGILIGRSGVVGYLKLDVLRVGVVVDVEIAALGESMVLRLCGRRREVVVNVCESVSVVVSWLSSRFVSDLAQHTVSSTGSRPVQLASWSRI